MNKCDNSFIVSMRNYMRHSPYIPMNHLKTSGSTMNTRWKGSYLILANLQTRHETKELETTLLFPNKPVLHK